MRILTVIIMKGANIRMKKLVLTISALLVSAAMVFSFAGCTGNQDDDQKNPSNAVVNEENSSDAAPVADATNEAATV